MEFVFTEEQQELRRSARRFLEATCTPERVMATMASATGRDDEAWSRMTEELGWTALTVPEAYGGLGMGYLDLHPLMEEMGRSLVCAPFFSTVCLGANAIALGGNEATKEELLGGIAEGTLTATVAHTAKGTRHGADAVTATYRRDGSDYVLSGQPCYVPDGDTADVIVVAARAEQSQGEEGISLFVVRGGRRRAHANVATKRGPNAPTGRAQA